MERTPFYPGKERKKQVHVLHVCVCVCTGGGGGGVVVARILLSLQLVADVFQQFG
jgi:hypothetical protein